MDFNFPDLFKNYSSVDLLKIIKRPKDYQPGAIAAAKQILASREVSQDEILIVENFYKSIDTKKQLRTEKINSYQEKVVEILEPIVKPQTEIKPAKWITAFLIVSTITYLIIVVTELKEFISFLQCRQCGYSSSILLDAISFFYIPATLFLLWKGKKSGWVLFFAYSLFSLYSALAGSIFFFDAAFIFGTDFTSLVITILVKIGFVCFLWRNDISDYFSVSLQTKKDAAVFTTIFSIIFIGCMMIFE